MMRFKFSTGFLILIMSVISIQAQDEVLIQDYSQLMNIPSIRAIEASPTHLYILSDQDGMAVFRIKPENLQ